MIIGLEILKELRAKKVHIVGDSQLVIKQLTREYKCGSLYLALYFTATVQILDCFKEVSFTHVPREVNWVAEQLAQLASGLRMS